MLRHPKGEIILGRLKFTEFKKHFLNAHCLGGGAVLGVIVSTNDDKKAVSRIPQEQKNEPINM